MESWNNVIHTALLGTEKRSLNAADVDERILKRAIRSKYRNSLSDDFKAGQREKILNTITNEYIDKIFLVGIKLEGF